MKKILLLFLLLLNIQVVVAKDYGVFCSSGYADKTFKGDLMSLSGVNFINKNIIEYQIQKAIKKNTGSNPKVNIEGFWGTSILDGEFKSFKAKSKNLFFNDVYLSDVSVESVCPYNKVNYKDNRLYFDENFVLKYSANITQDDLDKTIQQSQYQKVIDKINSNNIFSSVFKIEASKVEIKNDRLVLSFGLHSKDNSGIFSFMNKLPKLYIETGLDIEDGKIKFCSLNSNLAQKSRDLIDVINSLNPFLYNVKFDKHNEGKLDIEKVKIADSKIALEGYLTFEKNQF